MEWFLIVIGLDDPCSPDSMRWRLFLVPACFLSAVDTLTSYAVCVCVCVCVCVIVCACVYMCVLL